MNNLDSDRDQESVIFLREEQRDEPWQDRITPADASQRELSNVAMGTFDVLEQPEPIKRR